MRHCKTTSLGHNRCKIKLGNLVEPVKCMGVFGKVESIARWDGDTWLFIDRAGWFPAWKYKIVT